MHNCHFCGEPLKEGRGMMLVKSNGSVFYFCSHKCYKNFHIRNPAKVKWTKKYKHEKEIRLRTIAHKKSG